MALPPGAGAQGLVPLFKVPLLKVPVVPCSVAAAVLTVLTAVAQVVQGGVRQGRRRGNGGRALARNGRGEVGASVTPRGRLGNTRLQNRSRGHGMAS